MGLKCAEKNQAANQAAKQSFLSLIDHEPDIYSFTSSCFVMNFTIGN